MAAILEPLPEIRMTMFFMEAALSQGGERPETRRGLKWRIIKGFTEFTATFTGSPAVTP
jgi:hypothetical protein